MTPERREDDAGDEPGWRRYGTEYHIPVLCDRVVEDVVVDPNGVYVDATLGGGGHAAALLDVLADEGTVVGIDRDEASLEVVRTRLEGPIDRGRLRLVRGNFHRVNELVRAAGFDRIDGILFDLGVSTRQVDRPDRGFSYREDGPLDMRMDPSGGPRASEIVNQWSEEELARVLYEYGEERRSRALAHSIVEARPLETTGELAALLRDAVPDHEEVKTLSRVFQAIRIVVNRELEALEAGLEAATEVVRPAGRAVIISYHSLEDRRVKQYFKYGNFEGRPRRDLYGNLLRPWRPLTGGPVRPEEREVEANPRARSARLRTAERRDQSEDRPPAPA